MIVWYFDLQLPAIYDQCLSPLNCEFESHSVRGILDTIVCDTVCHAAPPPQTGPEMMLILIHYILPFHVKIND